MSKPETAQDVVNLINKVRDVIKEKSDNADHVKWYNCEKAVRRNKLFATLRQRVTAETATQLMLEGDVFALHEDYMLSQLDGMSIGLFLAAEHLDEARDALVEMWNARNEELKAASAKIAEMTARLSEHALHNAEVRETVWNITGGTCFYCDVALVRSAEGEDRTKLFHVDHLVPKAHGGPDHLHNYVPACERCNISKNSKSYVEFLAWRKAQSQPPALTIIEGGAA